MFRSPFPDVEIPDVSLPDFVLARAGQLGEKPALIDASSGRTLTYAQLVAGVRAVAGELARRGFSKGDVLAHYAPNLPEYAVTFFAVASLGGANTTANPLLTADELAGQLRESGARLLITVPAVLETARAAARAAEVREIFIYGEDEDEDATPFASLLAAGTEPPAVAIDPAEDVVVLPFSSGTTGLPKAVMLTHRNIVAALSLISPSLVRTAEHDRILAAAPFFHIAGMVTTMNLGLQRGLTIVTIPRFELTEYLRIIQDYRITHTLAVPPILLALTKDPRVDAFDLSSLKFLSTGAAPVSAELEIACARRLGCRIRQGYGMTETSGVSHAVVDDLAGQQPGSIGPALPNTEWRIVNVASGAELPPGQLGELCVRGPHVMKGYLNQPEATARTIDPDGWLHTGDIAELDTDGRLRIVDRLKELIKYKGYQVAPAELEALLITHPAIIDAAVIPVPDVEAGEVPKGFVVISGPLTPEDVLAFVAARVAPYKKLRVVEIVDAIPKSPSGKTLRRTLIERERASATG
jgi:acyl-CoA synthetase (AMP-forming)/AMP-acid ligase II